MLAERFSQARILALDLSEKNIASARAIFRHERVEFEYRDVLAGELPGAWDTIVFPDSYEHIQARDRGALHALLDAALSPFGRVLLACPTVMKQQSLRASGSGLQPIDEDVSLSDVQRLANDLHAEVSYFSLVQVWGSYDYLHAVVERGTNELRSLDRTAPIDLHRGLRSWKRVLLGGAERARALSHPLRTWRALRLALTSDRKQ
jgi:cyclopropane fatty-acyl-phospholipid synthase-like methyltransferase